MWNQQLENLQAAEEMADQLAEEPKEAPTKVAPPAHHHHHHH